MTEQLKMNSTLTDETVFDHRKDQQKLYDTDIDQIDADVDQIIQELDGIYDVASWAVFQLARVVNNAEHVDVVGLRVCEELAKKYNWNLNLDLD